MDLLFTEKKTLHKYNKEAAAAENFQSVTVLLSLSPTLYFLGSSYPKLFFYTFFSYYYNATLACMPSNE